MKKLYIMLSAAMLIVSCKKSTLELENPNQITSATYWKTENDVISSLAATYGLLRDVNGGFYGVRGVEQANGRGDDFVIRNDVQDLYQLSTFTNTTDNATASTLWNISYQAIMRANQILQNISKVPISADLQKRYIAEAKFLRGINYFILVINFGDVPIRLSVPQTTNDYFTAKSPEADVWKQVKQDFTDAAADLPVSYDAQWVGRATEGAALAYLGKADLYTKDWSAAETTLKQLTATPFSYQLMPNFGDNFIATKENNQESVFEIQLGDVGGTNPWSGENAGQALGVTTAQEFAPSEVGGWFEISPDDKLFNEFQKERTMGNDFDPRMYATLVWNYPGATFYNKPFSSYALVFGYKSLLKKYQNYNQTNEIAGSSGASDYTSSNNERALRYSDVLLMIAEAITMQGNVSAAYPFVQQIRTRAQLPPLQQGLTPDQMMAEIRHQRMIEFARENQRFYDLKRWGLLQQEITNSDKVGKQFFVPGKHDHYPIPQSELNSNPKITQNAGW
ncbi:RagB/SusD family nutrient uptake outer membrane protein [Mucilaginibacter sp. SMC90]|uniref:RagB/SusD family nutrient uptake outer membrane protein n=1 Tax=Mucilaginibacter sp. SMC90 TaxID=2929803 RepID=UPI001FB38219|nr:RagB/SusD family nutrient uptake outer membrane protein [Mucilaginibacter sp. SMC90]UOE47770.1 RagB/SusD family nutrient uptake outer membrane protein [Mucilaginibacter sp. SMC90]